MVRVLCALGLAGDAGFGGNEVEKGLKAFKGGAGKEGRKGGSTVFVQSHVKQHAELMWILSCTASMGYLGRMTQWKVCLPFLVHFLLLSDEKGGKGLMKCSRNSISKTTRVRLMRGKGS